MSGLPHIHDPNLLVGSATADDAGVYRLDDERALVQTLDFFTPIADDPYLFGQIAAANSLSDVYAMGGRPITAMAIAGMPADLLSNEDIAEIFRGGAEMVKRAQCALVGGHTIKNPEPIYGLSVTGLVHPEHYLANSHGREGDILLLTKPLGSGIVSTAVKRGCCPDGLEQASIEAMISLNTAGADLGEARLVNACTDITGFGLLGHLREMADGSQLTAIIQSDQVPAISPDVLSLIEQDCVPGGTHKNLENVRDSVHFHDSASSAVQLLLADAQTSGGLLLSVPPAHKQAVIDILESHQCLCIAEVGALVARQEHAIVCH